MNDIWKIPKYLETNTLLNNTWVGEIKNSIRKYFKLNGNENTGFHNLWDTAKSVLLGEIIGLKCLH